MSLYLKNQDIKKKSTKLYENWSIQILPKLELRLKLSKTPHGKWTVFFPELPGHWDVRLGIALLTKVSVYQALTRTRTQRW